MSIIPLIKLQNFRKRKIHIAHHRTSNNIYACILPHVCWKSPERACKMLQISEKEFSKFKEKLQFDG